MAGLQDTSSEGASTRSGERPTATGTTNLFMILAEAGEPPAAKHPPVELYDSVLDLVEKVVTCDNAVLLLKE